MTENNHWIVQTAKSKQVPIGFYHGKFIGVTDYSMQDGKVKWRFAWQILSGQEKDNIASMLTERSISPTTLPGRLISGLLNREIKPGDNVKDEIDACIGKTYVIQVQNGPQGGKPGVRSVGVPPVM